MAFKVGFTDEPDEYLDDDPTVPSAIGLITIGEFNENFVSSLYEWNKKAYESQWLQSLGRFLNGDKKAVLITWYVNPKESSNLQWWALYRGEAETVHVQNHLPLYDNFDREFSVAEATSFLRSRMTENEDGNAISEWDVPLGEVQLFFEELKVQRNDLR